MEKYLMGIDAGNTSSKVVIFDLYGKMIATAATPSMHFKRRGEGFEEFDVTELWNLISVFIKEAVEKAKSEGFENRALIEEYAKGQEYSVEYISYKGESHFLALTLKHTTGAPHFIETGHLEPAPVEEEILKKVKNIVSHALNTLGIENGASHSEIKIDENGEIKIIEIGARMGGDCIGSDLVRYSTGYDFVKMVIQVACGEEPDFTKVTDSMNVESVFIFTQEDLDEYEKIKNENPEDILKVVDYHPENIGKITDSSNRAGCYIRKAKGF